MRIYISSIQLYLQIEHVLLQFKISNLLGVVFVMIAKTANVSTQNMFQSWIDMSLQNEGVFKPEIRSIVEWMHVPGITFTSHMYKCSTVAAIALINALHCHIDRMYTAHLLYIYNQNRTNHL